MTTLADIAYLAGFFDGEGAIYVCWNHSVFVLYVSVETTDEPSVRRFFNQFGGSFVPQKARRAEGSATWRWTAVGHNAVAALRVLRPRLLTKAAQADLALRWPVGERGHHLTREQNAERWRLAAEIGRFCMKGRRAKARREVVA